MTILLKILITIAIIITDFFLQKIIQKKIDRYVLRNGMSQKRNLVMHKTKTVLIHTTAAVALLLMWGLSIENAWVTIGSFLGLVAIGFFAVWSILSNIFAGVVIFFTRPFKIDGTIEIIPDGIRGKVRDINGFFTLLTDEEGRTINIPNNMIYQKIIKTG